MSFILALIFSLEPRTPIIDDRVAATETNHLLDDCGNETFTQLIWWDNENHVIAWRIIKREPLNHGKGVIVFLDGEKMRRITSASLFESWTINYDPELHQRSIKSCDDRRELSKRP